MNWLNFDQTGWSMDKRQLVQLIILLSACLFLSACAENTHPVGMPDLIGKDLEIAKSDIKRAGYSEDIEIVGGGLFGIVVESNWIVCSQDPVSGEIIVSTPRLVVKRDCGVEDNEEPSTEPDVNTDASSSPDTMTEPDVSTDASSSPDTLTEPEPTTELEPSPEPLSSPEATLSGDEWAQEIEATYEGKLLRSISSMCDKYYTHWSCFYKGVSYEGYLSVNLTTDGGWSPEELVEMADTTGRHWYNFVGCNYPELDVIVVNINGLDYNYFRGYATLLCD